MTTHDDRGPTGTAPATAPAGPTAAPRWPAGRLLDYWWTVYRRTWRGSVVSSFVTPLLYVVAMGVLLGGFVQADPATLDGAPSYLAFVAPGMLAAASMQLVFGELTYNVYGGLKWHKTYYAMTATPLGPRDVVQAQVGYVLARVLLTAAVFCLVVAPFGIFAGAGGALVAVLVQPLVAVAFATLVYAFSVTISSESAFALLFRLGMLPLFLFSGAFFPVANLGPVLERLAQVSPLWHGVELTRMATLGTWQAVPALVHVGYLLVLGALGYRLAVRGMTRRLVV